jgi:lysophospholipase L1-like esterase
MGTVRRYMNALGFGGNSFDADAKLIIDTVGITDSTRKTYTNIFVKELKAAGFWDRIKMLHPFSELTTDSQKYNWKDLRDLDEAGRLTFIADAEGIHTDGFYKSGGATQWIRTHKLANIFTNNDISIIIYAEPESTGINVGAGATFYTSLGYTANVYSVINDEASKIVFEPNAALKRRSQLYIFSRNAINEFFCNVGDFYTKTVTVSNGGANPNAEIAYSAFNVAGSLPNTDKIGFIAIMDGVSVAEASQLQAIIQKYLYYSKPADKIRWLNFRGDSNTVGGYASDEAHKWVSLLSANRGIKVNSGVNGSTAKDFYDNRENIYFYNKLNILLTVCYGTNDLSYDIADTAGYTLADYSTRLNDTISFLIGSRKFPANNICLMSLPWQRNLSTDNRLLALQYRDAAQTVANTYGCRFVELFESMENGGGTNLIIESDNVHLNDLGHQFVYEKILEVL